jgi:CRP-like cAMP-binding protein
VPENVGDLLEDARRSELRWIRLGAMACAPMKGDPPPEEEAMERLLALKQVPLFENLSLEQLDALLQTTEEQEYLDGEVICREGERGDSLFLLLEGEVDIVKAWGTEEEDRLKRLEAIDYFGEMASLVDEPRSATAVAAGPCSLLTLEGAALKELILQMPEISFEIFRVLTSRLKTAERRAARTGG